MNFFGPQKKVDPESLLSFHLINHIDALAKLLRALSLPRELGLGALGHSRPDSPIYLFARGKTLGHISNNRLQSKVPVKTVGIFLQMIQ